MKCSRWQPQAIPTHMEHPLRPGAVPRQISPTNLQLRSKQIGHVESLFPNLGAHWISQMGGKVCKRCKHGRCQQAPNLIRLLEAKFLVLEPLLEPVAVIIMACPSGKRVAVIAACASCPPLDQTRISPSRLHQLPKSCSKFLR